VSSYHLRVPGIYAAKQFTAYSSAAEFLRDQRWAQFCDSDFGWLIGLEGSLRVEFEGVPQTLTAGSLYAIRRGLRSSVRIHENSKQGSFLLCVLAGAASWNYFSYLATLSTGSTYLKASSESVQLALALASKSESFNAKGCLERSLATFQWLNQMDSDLEHNRQDHLDYLSMQPEEIIKRPVIVASIKSLSRKLRANEQHLTNRLWENWMIPPGKGLQVIKLYHAARRLQGEDASIQSIGKSAGYSSKTVFPGLFRSEFGMSPSEFRSRSGQGLDIGEALSKRMRELRKLHAKRCTKAPSKKETDRAPIALRPRFAMFLSGKLHERRCRPENARQFIGRYIRSKGCEWLVFLKGTRLFKTPGQTLVASPGTILTHKRGVHANWEAEPGMDEKYLVLFSYDDIVDQIHSKVTKEFGWHMRLPLDHPFIQQSIDYVEQREASRTRKLTLDEEFKTSQLNYRWLATWSHLMTRNPPGHKKELDLSRTPVGVSEEQGLRALRSLKDYAKILGYSASHTSRLLPWDDEISTREVLTRTRIGHACEYLRETDMPIPVIAEKCGYSSQSSFGRAFKSIMNTSPLKYRVARRTSQTFAPRLR